MRTMIVMAVLALGACSDEQNLGDRQVLHAARWAVAAGSPAGNASASLMAIDVAGDVVAAGGFQGTVDFGTTTLTAPDTGAAWVGKRSGIDGSEQWTIPLSGTDFELTGLAVTPQRDVVVVGRYMENQDFGGQRLSSQQFDAYVAKYDPDGHLIWVTGLDPRSGAAAVGVAVGPDGQIIVSAEFTGTISLPDRIVAGGPYVVAALSPDGQVLWGRQQPVGGKVQVTSDGHAIIAGVVDASTMFGGTMIDLTRDPDMFLATLRHDGALESVHSFGTLGQPDLGLVWTLDPDGRIAAVVNGHDLRTSAPREMLLDEGGTQLWSASPASGAALADAIVATDDRVIAAGRITSDSFDPGDGVRVGAMYLTARDGNGALLDARVFGDPSIGGADAILALAAGPSGEVGFAGYIDEPIDFGSGPLVPSGARDHQSFVIGVLAN